MGSYVFVNISFPIDDANRWREIQEAASQALQLMASESYATDFLSALKDGDKCLFSGNKGSVCMWGGIFNYFNIDMFYRDIQPFCLHLYSQSLVADFENIITFWESEDHEKSNAMIIQYDEMGSQLQRADTFLPLTWRRS